MKTIRYFAAAVLGAVMLFAADESKAQLFPDSFVNIDWQVNVPLSTSFADPASGWGMNFEGGYFLTPHVSLGGFIAFHTNLESVPRQTLSLPGGGAMTTSQDHSVFQLPFGVAGRYTWLKESTFQPYVSMKMGLQFARISSYYYLFKEYDNTWGFYLSPEVGCTIFPCPENRVGIHLSLYYSYATNSGGVLTYKVDAFNNFGMRVGISF